MIYGMINELNKIAGSINTQNKLVHDVIKDDKYITKELVKIRNVKDLSENSRKIINKLIGDTKLRKKLRIITCSSPNSITCSYFSNIICGRKLMTGIDTTRNSNMVVIVKSNIFKNAIDELNYAKNNRDEILIYFRKED